MELDYLDFGTKFRFAGRRNEIVSSPRYTELALDLKN